METSSLEVERGIYLVEGIEISQEVDTSSPEVENGINLVTIEISQEWKQISWKWKRVFTW